MFIDMTKSMLEALRLFKNVEPFTRAFNCQPHGGAREKLLDSADVKSVSVVRRRKTKKKKKKIVKALMIWVH